MIYDKNLLLLLEVDPDSWIKLGEQEKKKTLKKAYHKLAQEFHPDKWSESSVHTYEEVTERFKEVIHAYKYITDPSYRNSSKPSKPQINLNAIFNINISFEQAFFGTEKTISYNPTHLDENGSIIAEEEVEIELEANVVKVVIPTGTVTGDKIQFRNMGMKQGDKQGDLLFVFNVTPHPKFNPSYGNPYIFEANEVIPLDILLAGGEIEVETIWGLKTARVPAGSKPGDIVNIINLGEGKLYRVEVRLQPKYPNKEVLKTTSLWKKLKINWNKEEELDEEDKLAEEDYEETFKKLGGYTNSATGPGSGWFGR